MLACCVKPTIEEGIARWSSVGKGGSAPPLPTVPHPKNVARTERTKQLLQVALDVHFERALHATALQALAGDPRAHLSGGAQETSFQTERLCIFVTCRFTGVGPFRS